MRSKKALLNTVFSLLLELLTIIVGLIVPRLILTKFGSAYNGITTSIAQFLTIIALLRSGAGGVTRAALYKPLADGDTEKVSSIIHATQIFMRKIAFIFLGILVVFACVYPLVINEFAWDFVFWLVLILGIDSFFNYCFGISYQILLMADQKEYIYSIIRIISTVFTATVTVLLLNLDFGIHIVKLGAALSALFSPFALFIYCRVHYKINPKATPDNIAINQRWIAFVHQIANYVHGNASVISLTLFAGDIKLVSVYAVYSMVISKIRTLIKSLTVGFEAVLGNMLAKREDKLIHKNFKRMECVSVLGSNFFFCCAGALILPFVSVYTRGVTDIEYIVPLFALLFTFAEYIYCLRIPFISLVQSAGHYKQTKNSAIIEAALNLIISIVGIFVCGIVGVAIGNLVAMLYKTVYLINYCYKNILKTSPKGCYTRLFVNMLVSVCVMSTSSLFVDKCGSYTDWFLLAIVVAFAVAVITAIIAMIFYFDDCKSIFRSVKCAVVRKR